MGDINTYAYGLLDKFVDAACGHVDATLRRKYGNDWFQQGVERHLHPDALQRTRKMLNSPMRVIDMGKTDEEIYGVEHLWKIIGGNWDLFSSRLENRQRTEVYLSEITELRNNLMHRRSRHELKPREVQNFVTNAQRLLAALGSTTAKEFESVAARLEQGVFPWDDEPGRMRPLAPEPRSPYYDFHRDLLRRLRDATSGFQTRSKGGTPYLTFRKELPDGFRLATVFERGLFYVELYIETPDPEVNDAALAELARGRDVVEAEIGEPLVWDRIESRKGNRVYAGLTGTIESPPERLEEFKQWALKLLPKFRDAFAPRIAAIDLNTLVADGNAEKAMRAHRPKQTSSPVAPHLRIVGSPGE